MGRTGHGITKMIEKALKSSPKQGVELEINVFNEKKPKNREEERLIKKAFYRAMNKLLEEEEIKIVNYAPSGTIKQSPTYHAMVFNLSKRCTRPDISNYLGNMNTNKKSYQIIRDLFKSKLEQLANLKEYRWNYLKTWIFYAKPEQIRNSLRISYDVDEVEDKLKKLNSEEEKALFSLLKALGNRELTETERAMAELFGEKVSGIPGVKGSFIQRNYIHLAALLKVLSKYEDNANARIWFYPMEPKSFNEDVWSRLPILPDTPLPGDPLPGPETPQDERTLTVQGVIDMFLYKYHMVDVRGKWNKDEALFYAGFHRLPRAISDPDLAFEHAIDIISTYPEEDKLTLKEILSKGLSDEPGSIQVFHDFYRKIERVNYSNRLKNVLGIISEHTETVSYDEFKELNESHNVLEERVRRQQIFIEDMEKQLEWEEKY